MARQGLGRDLAHRAASAGDPHKEVAEAVAHFNAVLNADNRPYLLIGVGRWGSNDPWLGIPVEWDEISGARVIVEAGFRDESEALGAVVLEIAKQVVARMRVLRIGFGIRRRRRVGIRRRRRDETCRR